MYRLYWNKASSRLPPPALGCTVSISYRCALSRDVCPFHLCPFDLSSALACAISILFRICSQNFCPIRLLSALACSLSISVRCVPSSIICFGSYRLVESIVRSRGLCPLRLSSSLALSVLCRVGVLCAITAFVLSICSLLLSKHLEVRPWSVQHRLLQ
jgi:hypothetical protein